MSPAGFHMKGFTMTMTHIRLEYLPTAASRKWRKSSLSMWAQGRANMEATAKALQQQEGWHAWRIIPYRP
jgi:hypothetical protein